MTTRGHTEEVSISLNGHEHRGTLVVPENARGLVLFAHGSGSSRLSPRNTYVAGVLQQQGVSTLLFDLLTAYEDRTYATRFDIELLTHRLMEATAWARMYPKTAALMIGYFGASTGAAAALRAAARQRGVIRAVVSRGGRPDLALDVLSRVEAPTLLLVGGHDDIVIEMNRTAYAELGGEKKLVIVPGATHLFAEPGTLEQVAEKAAAWFVRHFEAAASARRAAR